MEKTLILLNNYIKSVLSVSCILFILLNNLFLNYKTTFAYDDINTIKSESVHRFSVPKNAGRDYHVVTAQNLEIVGDISGDVYAFGKNVVSKANIDGDLIVFAGSLSVFGEIGGNLRAVAGTVNVGGKVGKNITALSGNLRVERYAMVAGGMATASSEVTILGSVLGRMDIASETAIFESTISSDVNIVSKNILFTKSANIEGRVNYYSENDAILESESSFSGILKKNTVIKDKPQKLATNSFFKFNFFGYISSFLVGIIIVRFMPKFIKHSIFFLNEQYWKTFFKGLVALILTPIVVFILFITIAGIPLSLILLCLYLISFYLSKIVFAYWIGKNILKIQKKYLSYIVGVTIYYLLIAFSAIAPAIYFIVLIFGIGSIFSLILKSIDFKKN